MQNKLYMKDFVTALLKDNIPLCYYYHNYEHTLYVLEKVIQIGRHEGCNEKEIELLSAAALWHDTGYINTYANHEQAGCVLAKEHLPAFGFTEDDIILITGMIMATKVPQAPKNKLEEIIADADLEYLGTISAEEKSQLLFKELHALIPSLTDAAWHKMQVTFIENHHYFTRYCKEYKEPIKQAYLKELVAAG